MGGTSKRLLEDAGFGALNSITVWVVVYRSSSGYYNYKKVAVIVTYPEDINDLYEKDSRDVIMHLVYTGAYQEYSDPKEVINAIKYIARKYRLHYKIVKLDWYYHFVSSR